MSTSSPGGVPGFGTTLFSDESSLIWRGRHGQDQVATRPVSIGATAVDVGNTPQTTLRAGLVMAIKASDGKAYPYNPKATDGTQLAVGVLARAQDMLENGIPVERFQELLVSGLVREAELKGLDPRAKTALSGRFLFDRDMFAGAWLGASRGVVRKEGDYTLSPSESGSLFLAAGVANFTLPLKQNGLVYRFAQSANANLVVTGQADLLAPGVAAATSITFSTANQRIGSQLQVECLYVNANDLRWLVTNLGGTTMTVA